MAGRRTSQVRSFGEGLSEHHRQMTEPVDFQTGSSGAWGSGDSVLQQHSKPGSRISVASNNGACT